MCLPKFATVSTNAQGGQPLLDHCGPLIHF